MAAKLIIAPEAEQDITDAYGWYEERRPGLGEEFFSCVDACIHAITQMPQAHPTVLGDFRRSVVHRFPYVIFYEAVGDTVTIYCIFHTSQDPAKWRRRLS